MPNRCLIERISKKLLGVPGWYKCRHKLRDNL